MSWLSDLFSGDAKLLNKIKAQDFGKNDSQIVSALINPKKAGGKLADWLGNQVSTAAGLPVQPTDEGDIYAREPDRFSKAMAALNIAGFAQGGSMPFAPKSAGGTLGTFIGPKAANWDKKAAATATQLLDNGVDPAQVWKEHLIGRMPDKSLFSEIDDSASNLLSKDRLNGLAKNDPYGVYESPIGDVFNHKKLFNDYPELNKTSVYYDADSHDVYGASFNSNDRQITLGAGLDDKQLHSSALHELQHAIQDREGWAQGGSPKTFKNKYVANRARLNFLENEPDIKKVNDEYSRNINAILDDATDYKDAELKIKDLEEELMRNYPGFAEQQKVLRQLKGSDSTGIKPYRRLTGEAQSRATQDRMNLNMQQRRDSYPLAKGLLADIPLKDLISRYK